MVLRSKAKPLASLSTLQVSPVFLDGFELAGMLACLALLFASVLAFGAVETWSMAMLELGVALLLAAWAMVQAARGRVWLRLSPLFPPAALFAAVAAVQLLAGISQYKYETWLSVLLYAAYGVLLFLTAQFLRTKRHFRMVAWMLSGFGILLALFAITQDLTSGGLLYWVRQPRNGGAIYGPYVNRNHYAGMMEMLFMFPLTLSMSGLVSDGKRLLLAFGGSLMAASIVFSQSRAGMVVLLLQVLLLSGFMAHRRQGHRASRIILMLAPISLLAWWLGNSGIVHRWSEASAADRLPIWRDVVSMILHKPLLGFGLGNFSTAFPPFRSVYSSLFVNAAHNDYLQVVSETGIIGGAALLWLIFALYRHGLPQTRSWHQNWVACVRLAAIAGCTGIVLHSFVDFNLQIPANAAMFLVLAALATTPDDSAASECGFESGKTSRVHKPEKPKIIAVASASKNRKGSNGN
jgi:O-antigen ligase